MRRHKQLGKISSLCDLGIQQTEDEEDVISVQAADGIVNPDNWLLAMRLNIL